MGMNFLKGAAALAISLAGGGANALVVCNSCDFTGQPGSYLGVHNPVTEDNSTFSNATTGTNGDFSNIWVFDINPRGLTAVNAVFLPIANISNFDVKLYDVVSATCLSNTATTAGACTEVTLGAALTDGVTAVPYATVSDFTLTEAGKYAFIISGTISNLGPTQPASYTGNLQVNALAVPEPDMLALVGLGLVGLGFIKRRRA